MRVVVDPNVIISAMLSPGAPPDRVVQAVLGGAVTVVVSSRVLDEVRDVVARPKFATLDGEEVERVLDGFAAGGVASDPPEVPVATRDRDDDYLIALAQAAGAEVLVSGDRDLLEADVAGVALRSPRQFVDEYLTDT